MPRESSVLFVCLHGSAKSVIAAEHFRRLAAERRLGLVADAAGMEPDADIPPHVIAGLAEDGIDAEARRVIVERVEDLVDRLTSDTPE